MKEQVVKKQRRPTNGLDKRPHDINRAGAPEKAWQWREIFLAEVEKDSRKREAMKRKQSMAIAQIEKAEEGDTQAFNAVLDRMEGKPKQSPEDPGSSKENPIHIAHSVLWE